MNIELLVALITIGAAAGGGAFGIVFAAGKFAARLESLERWRLEMTNELHNIYGTMRRIEGLVRRKQSDAPDEPSWSA